MATKYRGPKGASWASQAFQSKTAKAGGVIRRSLTTAKKVSGLSDLISLARSKGYSVYVGGGQIVIFCNDDPIHDFSTFSPVPL